jgi:hypothetical protein
MTVQTDLAAVTASANTWAAQLKAGTPYSWAEAATLIGLANLAKEIAPPPTAPSAPKLVSAKVS